MPKPAREVLSGVIGNPELLARVEQAPTPEEKRELLHQAGLREGEVNPAEVRAEVERLLRTHGRNKPAPAGVSEDEMAAATEERPVEWVAAIATLAVAAL